MQNAVALNPPHLLGVSLAIDAKSSSTTAMGPTHLLADDKCIGALLKSFVRIGFIGVSVSTSNEKGAQMRSQPVLFAQIVQQRFTISVDFIDVSQAF